MNAALAGREDEVRAVCAEELARVLNADPSAFDASSDFDRLGLDSVDALVALGAISDRLGVDLPPELLFVHRSLDAAVRALTRDREPVRSAPDRTHGFWFPGGGILDEPLVIGFRSRLGAVVPFDVIHVGSWRDWRRRHRTLDDLAAAALAQIEAAAPAGPLLLAGDSQGGQLAYATALAAGAAGREVAGVVLFDTAATYSAQSAPAVAGSFFRRGAELLRSRRERSLGDVRAWLAWHVEQLAIGLLSPDRLMALVAWWSPASLKGAQGPVVDRRMQMLAFGVLWAVWPQSRRRPLDAPVVLLRSEDPGPRDLGWGASFPRLRIVPVPGGHRTMFAPDNAASLADAFCREVAPLTGRGASPPEGTA